MSEEKKLGRLEKVELRKFWSNEAGDFTPWLAEEENLNLLADTLGMQLEFENREVNVGEGGFKADILCQKMEGERVLGRALIENQLERTDHNHLGQILTYASGLDVETIIWVAKKFRDEHRAALDWLNEITAEDRSFFGVEIELWQIGDSRPAPKFNIVCKPNDWSRTTRRSASENPSELYLLRGEYWDEFDKYLKTRGNLQLEIKQKAEQGPYFFFEIGNSNMHMDATRTNKLVRATLWMNGNAKPYFRALQSQEKKLKDEFGSQLQFKENEVSSFIWLPDDQALPLENRDDWLRQFEWLNSKLQRFDEVFRPLIEKIDPADWESRDGDGDA